MPIELDYVINFVADMNEAVAFYRDTLRPKLRFQSPGWSEFETGHTVLALHPSSQDHPAGNNQLAFRVADIHAFQQEMTAKGYQFSMPPRQEHGVLIARFLDKNGHEYSVSNRK